MARRARLSATLLSALEQPPAHLHRVERGSRLSVLCICRTTIRATVIENETNEIPQIATRLQACHVDLYNKYDRLLSEASLRYNIPLPSIVLSFLIIFQSDVVVWQGILATVLAMAIGSSSFVTVPQDSLLPMT
jgi:hypothetical protein